MAVILDHFNLDDIPQRDRGSALNELAGGSSVPFNASLIDSSRPVTYIHRSLTFGPGRINTTTLANYRGLRTTTQARGSSEQRLVLALGMPGSALDIEQDGRQTTMRARSIVMFGGPTGWAMHANALQTVRALSIPLDALNLPHLLIRDLLAVDLCTSPLSPVFSAHVNSVNNLPMMSEAVSVELSRATLEMVRALLTTASGDDSMSRGPLRRTLGTRILLYVKANLTDPTLSGESLAAAFNISRRYLYVIMRDLDISLADWIRQERLKWAADTLADPVHGGLPISVVAHAAGFSEHSTFCRAFKSQFGCTPSEWVVGAGMMARDGGQQ